MKSVFVVQHVHELDGDNEDVKFIGVYSTHKNANKAVERFKLKPGFKESPNGFCVDEYPINKDHWAEGYVTG